MDSNVTTALDSECDICCEKYNNSTRRLVKCEYGDCNTEMCKTCVRTCLMGTVNDPHCFACKKPFTEKYLVEELGRTWVTSTYREHRREMLFQREGIAKLPDSMLAAANYTKIKREQDLILCHREELTKLKLEENAILARINNCHANIHRIRNGESAEKKTAAAIFTMPCTADDCRGYLSTAYKCGICHLYTCPKCFDLIGHTRGDNTHVCKEENVQSAELIRKETKPCPSCGTRIHKIDGCDQMFCTHCKKPWSWNTGKIDVSGRIHNPHYYQLQREMAARQGTAVPREPGDAVCGGLLDFYRLRSVVFPRLKDSTRENIVGQQLRTNITDLHQFVSHIINVDLREIRRKITQFSEFENIRVEYIVKKITKDIMAAYIYRTDNMRKKQVELLHIYELINVVGVELFNAFNNSANIGDAFIAEVTAHMDEYNKLRVYCNDQFANISRTYNQTVPQIDCNWHMVSRRFKMLKKDKIAMQAAEEGAEGAGAGEKGAGAEGAGAEGARVEGAGAKKKKSKKVIVVN